MQAARTTLVEALSASDSVDVRVGQEARLQVEDRPETMLAKVKRVSPSAQAGTRSVLVFLSLDKSEGLRHGLFVKGTLSLAQNRVMAVPLTAVRTDRAKPYVQLVQPVGEGLQVAHQMVELGARGLDPRQPDGETWVAVTGLAEGSRVIQGQLGSLRAGLAVKYSPNATTGTPAP